MSKSSTKTDPKTGQIYMTQADTPLSEAADAFIEADRKVFVFNRTILGFQKATDGAVGSVEEWTTVIDGLADSTNFMGTELRTAAAETESADR